MATVASTVQVSLIWEGDFKPAERRVCLVFRDKWKTLTIAEAPIPQKEPRVKFQDLCISYVRPNQTDSMDIVKCFEHTKSYTLSLTAEQITHCFTVIQSRRPGLVSHSMVKLTFLIKKVDFKKSYCFRIGERTATFGEKQEYKNDK